MSPASNRGFCVSWLVCLLFAWVMWRIWERANTALREAWKRQQQLLEALRGI